MDYYMYITGVTDTTAINRLTKVSVIKYSSVAASSLL